MIQLLKALTALPEDTGSIPSIIWQLITICNSSSKGSDVGIRYTQDNQASMQVKHT